MNVEHIIPVEDTPEKKSKGKGVFAVFGVLALFIAVGYISYYAGSNTETEKAKVIPATLKTETLGVQTEENDIEVVEYEEVQAPTPPIEEPETSKTSAKLKSVTIYSEQSDGFITSDGIVSVDSDIKVGRTISNHTRGFVGFDLSSLPPNAQINKAALRVYVADVTGSVGAEGLIVLVDNLDFGGSLNSSDYHYPANKVAFNSINEAFEIGWKELDVTNALADDYEGGINRSQYRLRLLKEDEGKSVEGDYIHFESKENHLNTGNTPQLLVEYY